jgi:uncharacterized protein YqeY
MSLENTINEAIKTAMRAKDKVALDSLRAVKSQIFCLKRKPEEQKFLQNRKLLFFRE